MRILSVDTSSELGSICVTENGRAMAELRLSSSVQHSERLFAGIEFLFRYLHFQLDDLDMFVSSRGPGSFTGLRVGLAAMEGFASAFAKTAAGISTLQALAWNSGESGHPIAAMVDARRGEVYGAVYQRVGAKLIEESAPVVLKPAAWLDSLPPKAITFCGDGALRYRDVIQAYPHDGWSVREVDLYLARAMAELARTPARGPLSPLYIRKTDAEIARESHESITSPHS